MVIIVHYLVYLRSAIGKAKLLVKDNGIIAGIDFAKQVFMYVDAGMKIEVLIEDGSAVSYGDIAFYVTGSSQSILKAERLVLKCHATNECNSH